MVTFIGVIVFIVGLVGTIYKLVTKNNYKKWAVVTVLSFIIVVIINSGGSNTPPQVNNGGEKPVVKTDNKATVTETPEKKELKELAAKERSWLEKLEPTVAKINAEYKQWEDGQITRKQLAEKLSKHKTLVAELRSEYEQYYLSHKLPDDIKKDPDYNKGLYYGGSLRLNVMAFLTSGTNISISDEKLKNLYEAEMKVGYDRKIELLKPAIEKYTK